MNINLSLSAAPGITSNYLVVAVYNSTAPNTVVASQSFPAPHVNPVNITFTGLNPTVYIVKTYESTDGSASGVVRHQFIYNPTYGTAQVRLDLVLVVGTSPNFTAGATSYNDTSLSGWNYTIERRGVGTLVNSTLSTSNPDYNNIATGGFQLLKAGDVFGNGEIFILHFQPIITNAAPTVSQTAGVLWGSEKDITVDTTLVAADMGKYCLIQGTNAVVNITLPASNAVADGTMIAFLSEGGSHLAANIKPAGTDQIKWIGDTWTGADPLTMCQSEELWLTYHGNAWRVVMADGGWRTIGEFVYTYSQMQPNLIKGDGNIYNRTYYPRLWRWVNQKLAAALLVTDTNWSFQQQSQVNGNPYNFYPNVGKFSSGDGATTFRMPLLFKTFDSNNNLKAGGFLRATDGATDVAGVQNADTVGYFIFNSSLQTGDSYLGHPYSPTAFGKGMAVNAPFNLPQQFYVNSNKWADNTPSYETKPFSTNAYLYMRY